MGKSQQQINFRIFYLEQQNHLSAADKYFPVGKIYFLSGKIYFLPGKIIFCLGKYIF
jgi:hypothetical protein